MALRRRRSPVALKPARHTDELTPLDVTGADDDDDDDDWFWFVLPFFEVFNLDNLFMVAPTIHCTAVLQVFGRSIETFCLRNNTPATQNEMCEIQRH